ncbi:MAG: Trk family potassium uptake protein [Christensenellaceae bacterium]|nr:Trk family potassium uptake protein [Christensenellaceae bacterium]
MLPFATRDGLGASFPDALFTAISATCVTGLVVRDTATTWSGFGQAALLVMIQVGGMGVVTMAVAIATVSGKKISLMQRSTMQEAISAPKVGGIVQLTGFILRLTFLFEALGAAALATVFIPRFGLWKGVWYSVFHAVSAFCNAGFDLMGAQEPFSSLTGFAAQPVVNVALMLLIVIGGIGFLTWEDVITNRLHVRRYRMQTKVILVSAAVLVLLPAVYLFFFELGELPLTERVWTALFQSVTMRTAGFNTVDLAEISESGQAMMIVLMLTGGAPGSTAGGMKTTTLVVMLSTAAAVFGRHADTRLFGRRIDDDTVRRAATILTLYLLLFLIGGCLISRIESLPLTSCLFETASAVGTVGVTLGLTPSLGMASRVILMLLMFFGRVGGLTLIFAALAGYHPDRSKLPQERLTVG